MKGDKRILLGMYVGIIFFGLAASCASFVQGVTSAAIDTVLEDDPPQLEAIFVASPELNPDYEGQPSPLVVRLYELTNITEFNAASFFPLYERDTELLGADIKYREEIVMVPGETKEFKRELNMDTRHVGIIGAYRDLEGATWRASIETPINKTTEITITMVDHGITIAPKAQ